MCDVCALLLHSDIVAHDNEETADPVSESERGQQAFVG